MNASKGRRRKGLRESRWAHAIISRIESSGALNGSNEREWNDW